MRARTHAHTPLFLMLLKQPEKVRVIVHERRHILVHARIIWVLETKYRFWDELLKVVSPEGYIEGKTALGLHDFELLKI